LTCLTASRPLGTPVALAGAASILLLTACGGSPAPTPTPDPRIGQVLERLDQLTEAVRGLEERIAGAPIPTTPTPSGASQATKEPMATPTLTPVPPTVTPGPTPTPNPNNADWVKERLDAVSRFYDLTDAGVALLRSLDLRQMRGEPGFFGSFGFQDWAGVGEAKPIGVIHELGHSYWGGFPVQGFPQLSWDTPRGRQLSSAMESYHDDILAFMAQPPDDFEVFRQRFRNLPEVSNDNKEPLFHNLEADMVYGTGGNLALVPPILRKYWSQFLKEGPFDSWYDAVGWYQSLTDDNRTSANKYLGFEHLDLRSHHSLQSPGNLPDLVGTRLETLAQEEKQRLFDLADQFDLLLGEAQEQENFQFWRGYLKDKVTLYDLHEEHLASLELPRATDLAAALEFIVGLSGLSPREQAERLSDQLPRQPFLVNFLPALDNRALLELFAIGTPLPQGATLQATASFVERLEHFSGEVDDVLTAGRADPAVGAQRLEEFLAGTDFELKEDLRLFFELFREEDPETANLVVRSLDKDTVRRLLKPVPAQLRFVLSPEELLAKLDISAEAEVSLLKRGISLLVEEPSGNFTIDEPFLDEMYQVIAARRRADTRDMLRVLQETPFPLEGFIQKHPRAAAALLDSDLDAALRLVRESDPVLSPPARIIYRLISADPALAARLTQALGNRGEAELVVESLAYLAYDESRSERVPELGISLEQDGKYLRALVGLVGADRLAQSLSESFAVFSQRVAGNQVPSDFMARYLATLRAAAATLPEPVVRGQLRTIIDGVAREYPVGR